MNGHMSVDMFFVISGFLVGFIVVKEIDKNNGKFRYKRWMIRRFLRLVPALFIFFWIFRIEPREKARCDRNLNWLKTFTFLNNWWPHQEMCVTHSWSLSVEMQFYTVTPAVFMVAWRYVELLRTTQRGQLQGHDLLDVV